MPNKALPGQRLGCNRGHLGWDLKERECRLQPRMDPAIALSRRKLIPFMLGGEGQAVSPIAVVRNDAAARRSAHERSQWSELLDFLEFHLWMHHYSDFYDQVGYHYERFDTKGYENLQLKAEKLYRSKPDYWKSRLTYGIDQLTAWSNFAHKPLITTECWSLVDYKDYPLLSWDWLKELCEVGVRHATQQGRWAAMATSNFCGPQFVGMWRDAEWHRRLTDVIHGGSLPW